ncbi:MAG: response regulator [Chthoniobacterales bacterium]
MKTLVLIDSDPLSRALLSQCLVGGGWRVLESDTGEAGLRLVQEHRPNAVLCDLRTPKGNGFKVCRSIREEEQLKGTRVVLTSVSRFTNDRDSALAAGADDYLIKPISPAELLETLAQSQDSAAAAPTPPLVFEGPVRIRFWGVRGSIPTPGRATARIGGNTSCVEVRVGNEVIILDAGSGIRALGKALLEEANGQSMNVSMLVTHTHWDHIQGFPFFLPAYNPKVNVRILGYEGAVHGLRGALFEQMQSAFFPVGLNQMSSHVTFEELEDMQFDLGAAKVRTIFSNHPGICLSYRLSTPRGDIVYMPDHEAYERHERERQKVANESSEPGIEYAQSQDEKVIEFMRDADVVISDSQYDRVEYPTRLGWGHTCADDTVDLAIRAGVKQLFLFHHDPDHDDAKIEDMVAEGQAKARERGSKLTVSAAREGAEFLLQ